MQLAHRRNQKTLLGAVVFLLVTAVIVYLFISFVNNYQINRIAKLNEKYGVSSGYLVPDDYLGYAGLCGGDAAVVSVSGAAGPAAGDNLGGR